MNSEPTAEALARSLGAKRNGRGWIALCPIPGHDDHNPSLSIESRGGKTVFICRTGCPQEAVIAAFRERVWPEPKRGNGLDESAAPRQHEVAVYDYCDADGRLVFQVHRMGPRKTFWQSQPGPDKGGIKRDPATGRPTMEGVTLLPYRLPELLARPGETVFICEGEKDVDKARDNFGVVGTTNPGGAGNWPDEISHWLKGRDAFIVPDNDKPGRRHVKDVARKLVGIVASFRVIELPGLPLHGDFSDWIAACGTCEDFTELALAAPEIDPNDLIDDPDPEAVERPPQFSDDALALRFAEKHEADARHVAAWGKWLFWDGARWDIDDTLLAFDTARAITRTASAEATKASLARAIASNKAVAATVSLARADRRHAAATELWDANPWRLAAVAVTVDLRTGTTRPPQREDYCTKITAVAPGGQCPRWLKFLDEITAGNAELQAFMQRMAGYCLTGVTAEHAIFFCYGTGGNGKGVFINTLAAIWGDYATPIPMTTLLASKYEQHPTELAMLRGARLAVAYETEKGRRWGEAKIKRLTGGDPIPDRFMRQDFFTFIPQFKLLVAGNHKPGLRDVDEAIRRRFHLIPFNVTFPKPDTELLEKLKPEWPGILQWAVDGCLEWQRSGLAPPTIVRDATAKYLASEDSFANWIDERCHVDPSTTCRRSSLFPDWKAWAEKTGEPPGRQRDFLDKLEQRGFTERRDSATDIWMVRGLNLKPTQTLV
jgi:putative DNA primase/helicase